jgi:hypothetical protein
MAGASSHFRTAARTRDSGARGNATDSVSACGGEWLTRVNASIAATDIRNSDGGKYEGEWRKNKREGHGSHSRVNGTCYSK